MYASCVQTAPYAIHSVNALHKIRASDNPIHRGLESRYVVYHQSQSALNHTNSRQIVSQVPQRKMSQHASRHCDGSVCAKHPCEERHRISDKRHVVRSTNVDGQITRKTKNERYLASPKDRFRTFENMTRQSLYPSYRHAQCRQHNLCLQGCGHERESHRKIEETDDSSYKKHRKQSFHRFFITYRLLHTPAYKPDDSRA